MVEKERHFFFWKSMDSERSSNLPQPPSRFVVEMGQVIQVSCTPVKGMVLSHLSYHSSMWNEELTGNTAQNDGKA